jgi:hypothetical protein
MNSPAPGLPRRKRPFLTRVRNLSLPLLARDLREQSAQPRTYLLRVVYAVAFFTVVFWHVNEVFSFLQSGMTAMDLGRGYEIFDKLILWQLAGIYVVMPVICAGSIAGETERDTLSLLLTTNLDPRTILLEKLCSRACAMLSLALMSLPLLAYAYSLGGIRTDQFIGAVVLLTTTTLHVGSFTLLCSAWCSSTSSALVTTLIIGAPAIGLTMPVVVPAAMTSAPGGIWAMSALIQLFFTWIFLRLSRAILKERGAMPHRSVMLEFLRAIDRVFKDLNDSLFRGVTVARDDVPLPQTQPIVWRGRYRRSLGTLRYQVRLLLFIEIPIVVLGLMAHAESLGPGRFGGITLSLRTVAIGGLWLVAITVLGTTAAGLIPSERSRQTFDALLVSPLSGREIVLQYMAGLRRTILALVVPFVTIFCVPLTCPGSWLDALLYLVGSLTSLAVLLPLILWTSMLIGLRSRSQVRAVLTSTLYLLAWAVLPLAIYGIITSRWNALAVVVLSPTSIVLPLGLEQYPVIAWEIVVLGCLVYGSLAWLVRKHCLDQADALLGRSDGAEPQEGCIHA